MADFLLKKQVLQWNWPVFSWVTSSFRFFYEHDLPKDLSVSSMPAHKPYQQLVSSSFPPSHTSSLASTSFTHHSPSLLKGPLQLPPGPSYSLPLHHRYWMSLSPLTPCAPAFSVWTRAPLSPRSLCETHCWDCLLLMSPSPHHLGKEGKIHKRGGKCISFFILFYFIKKVGCSSFWFLADFLNYLSREHFWSIAADHQLLQG